MITWQEELPFDFTDPVTDRMFTESAIFFDIETTGFSPARTSLYLIGCATRKGNMLCLHQFFAETKNEEAAVLSAFFSFLAQYDSVLSFNGLGFDIPYLKAKCQTYHMEDPFSSHSYVDIYKEISRMKHLLALPNLKQKSIEIFLGIEREDSYSGGELIEVYREYTKHPTEDALLLMRRHNYEDVLYMPKILPILSYPRILDGAFRVSSIEADQYTSYNGSPCKELIITAQNEFSVPRRISFHQEDFHLILDQYESKFFIRLLEGELKYFFSDYRNYFYLPEEDLAVHKNIAASVPPERKKKATAATCYTRKNAIFIPQYKEIMVPAFRRMYKDKKSYFELSESFATSEALQTQYIMHILEHTGLKKN